MAGKCLTVASSPTTRKRWKVEAEVKQFEVKPGDRILLCSDGLYKSMSHNTLKTRLMDDKPLEDIINDYDLLCEKHGDDNYTAIIMEIQ